MTDIDYSKLQDALEEIKKVCEKHSDVGCIGCPLGSRNGLCRLWTYPAEWSPKHPEVEDWDDVFHAL